MKIFTAPATWTQCTPVHNYQKSFAELANQRLPTLFKLLQNQIDNSIPLEIFSRNRMGPATLSRNANVMEHLDAVRDAHEVAKNYTQNVLEAADRSGNDHDFAGVYVFLSGKSPFYVGITRTIFRRIQSHARSKDHYSASLLFRMVCMDSNHSGPRAGLDLKSERARAIRSWFQQQSVAILPLACPVERYAFELYAAMELQTGVWNTFETH